MTRIIYASFILAFVFLSCSKKTNDLPPSVPPPSGGETPKIATIETHNVTQISYETATGSATVIDNGNATITDRGVCYGTNANPTIEDNKAGISSLKANGEFVCQIKGLIPETTYYLKSFAKNAAGVAHGNQVTFKTLKSDNSPQTIILADSTTFNTLNSFEQYWGMLYPWGKDHNGSARMYKEQVSVEDNGILKIQANRTEIWEGNSELDPYLRIFYHSGAIHLKNKITVTDDYPKWIISGDFQVPFAKGSWPAFWITGVNNWPPESDIMEFKGSSTNWQNTATGPDWQNVAWQNKLTNVVNPQYWHNYKIEMQRISANDLSINYYIDGIRTATHQANFMNMPFWLIINLQMEGASGNGGTSLQNVEMKARNIFIAGFPK